MQQTSIIYGLTYMEPSQRMYLYSSVKVVVDTTAITVIDGTSGMPMLSYNPSRILGIELLQDVGISDELMVTFDDQSAIQFAAAQDDQVYLSQYKNNLAFTKQILEQVQRTTMPQTPTPPSPVPYNQLPPGGELIFDPIQNSKTAKTATIIVVVVILMVFVSSIINAFRSIPKDSANQSNPNEFSMNIYHSDVVRSNAKEAPNKFVEAARNQDVKAYNSLVCKDIENEAGLTVANFKQINYPNNVIDIHKYERDDVLGSYLGADKDGNEYVRTRFSEDDYYTSFYVITRHDARDSENVCVFGTTTKHKPSDQEFGDAFGKLPDNLDQSRTTEVVDTAKLKIPE